MCYSSAYSREVCLCVVGARRRAVLWHVNRNDRLAAQHARESNLPERHVAVVPAATGAGVLASPAARENIRVLLPEHLPHDERGPPDERNGKEDAERDEVGGEQRVVACVDDRAESHGDGDGDDEKEHDPDGLEERLLVASGQTQDLRNAASPVVRGDLCLNGQDTAFTQSSRRCAHVDGVRRGG